jgi:hypothetical protein
MLSECLARSFTIAYMICMIIVLAETLFHENLAPDWPIFYLSDGVTMHKDYWWHEEWRENRTTWGTICLTAAASTINPLCTFMVYVWYMRNEIKEDILDWKNIPHKIKRRKTDWIGHVLRMTCLLKHVIEGKIKGTGRRRRRRKHIKDDLKGTRRYWNLKKESVDRIRSRTRFGRGYRSVLRQTTEWWFWSGPLAWMGETRNSNGVFVG